MTTAMFSLALAIAASSIGQCPECGRNHKHKRGGQIVVDGPGNGYGFPNGNPDGYGWVDYGTALPLGANRTGEYYFPRFLAVPPVQMFLPSYYNPYVTRGQRYVPYGGNGGMHPMGGFPMSPAALPTNPYNDTLGNGPRVAIPPFSGRIEAPPVNTGGSGLTP